MRACIVCVAWNSKPKLQQSDFNPPVWSTFVFPFQKIDTRKEIVASDGTVSLGAFKTFAFVS